MCLVDLTKTEFLLAFIGQIPCGNHEWVPYDSNISPVENLVDKPDDLDPQPEYPLRTKLTFYKEEMQPPPSLEILEGDVLSDAQQGSPLRGVPVTSQTQSSPFPSATVMLIFWVLGLVMWCMVYMKGQTRPRRMNDKKTIKDV
jgi:hypothetical protein